MNRSKLEVNGDILAAANDIGVCFPTEQGCVFFDAFRERIGDSRDAGSVEEADVTFAAVGEGQADRGGNGRFDSARPSVSSVAVWTTVSPGASGRLSQTSILAFCRSVDDSPTTLAATVPTIGVGNFQLGAVA